MTRPVTSSKVLLIVDHRAGAVPSAGAPVRRFRLARLPVADRARPAQPSLGSFDTATR